MTLPGRGIAIRTALRASLPGDLQRIVEMMEEQRDEIRRERPGAGADGRSREAGGIDHEGTPDFAAEYNQRDSPGRPATPSRGRRRNGSTPRRN